MLAALGFHWPGPVGPRQRVVSSLPQLRVLEGPWMPLEVQNHGKLWGWYAMICQDIPRYTKKSMLGVSKALGWEGHGLFFWMVDDGCTAKLSMSTCLSCRFPTPGIESGGLPLATVRNPRYRYVRFRVTESWAGSESHIAAWQSQTWWVCQTFMYFGDVPASNNSWWSLRLSQIYPSSVWGASQSSYRKGSPYCTFTCVILCQWHLNLKQKYSYSYSMLSHSNLQILQDHQDISRFNKR